MNGYPLLIKQLWHAPLAQSADQQIVYRDRVRFSYRELFARVGRLATVLESFKVRHGDIVAVMDWDSHRYLECYFAVPMMGAVLMTVNVRLAPEQIIYTLNHSGASVLLLHGEFLALFHQIRPRLEAIRLVIWLTDEERAPPESAEFAGEYESLLGAATPKDSFPDFDENTRATTFYTTGTTGNPKGVFFSHRQLVLHTITLMAALASPAQSQRFHRADVYMPITPMFHVHAWGMPYVALQLGVKQVYPGRYEPGYLLELIRREGVSFSHCVPTILQMLLSSPHSREVDLSRWKVVTGGSALPVGLAREARQRGIDVFAGYGMSETCPVLTLAQVHPHFDDLDSDAELEFRCSAGYAIPLVELRTVDDKGSEPGATEKGCGEVVVRAPWLTQGYLHQPEASAELWAGGHLHTQDVGSLDRGCLRITDRIKDVIKSGGEWVSSLQLEELVLRHPAISECAVIGVKDERWGERPLVVIARKAGQTATEDDIRSYLAECSERGLISRYAVPDRIVIVLAIAKTGVGKTDKRALRNLYGTN